MDDTAHANSTASHPSSDIKPTSLNDFLNNVRASAERRFTFNQVFTTIATLLIISGIIIFFLSLHDDRLDFNEFWQAGDADSKGTGSDIPSLLASLDGTQASLIALIIFHDVSQTIDARHHFNDQRRTTSIKLGIIGLALASQALLTLELPQLIHIMHPMPGWILAFIFLLVNVIAMLSVSDFAGGVVNAHKTAKEKITQYETWKTPEQQKKYQMWKNKHHRKKPEQAALHKAMILPFVVNIIYLILTFLPYEYTFVAACLRQRGFIITLVASLTLIAILGIIAWLFSRFVTPLFLSEYLSASASCASKKAKTPDKVFSILWVILLAADVLALQLLINLSFGFPNPGTPTCRVVTQVIAGMVAFTCVLLLSFAQPRQWTLPYLMMMCDNEIKNQDNVLDRAASIFEDLSKQHETNAAAEAPQTPAAGYRSQTAENTGNGYDTITGEGTPRSRSDAWRIGFGLQAAAGLEPSDYAIAQAQDQIAGDVSYAEVEQNLRDYHAAHKDKERHFEADIVATRISSLLQDPSFVFSPAMLDYIHERLFQGVLPGRQAGVRRSSDFSEREPLPGGGRVAFVPHRLVDRTLRRAFDQERRRRGSYAGMPRRDIADSVTGFISGLWQVRPFSKGNTRAVMVLAIMYLRLLGFTVNPEPFSSHGAHLHDALVLDNVLDPDVRDPAPLRRFMDAVLFDPGIDLPPAGTRDDDTGHAL